VITIPVGGDPISHPRVCPMLHTMPYVHLNPDHNNRTKIQYIGIELTRA